MKEFNLHTTNENVEYLTCNLLTATGLVKHGFSTRNGGVSKEPFKSLNLGVNTEDIRENVEKNYEVFCSCLGMDVKNLVLSDQVHGDYIHVVTEKDKGKGLMKTSDLTDVDGLITNMPGIPMATFYADCTPFLMLDPVKRVIATVHSGWKGTLKKIAVKTVKCFQTQFGSEPKDIIIAIGPNIKSCHFEVSLDVYRQFTEVFGQEAKKNTVYKNGKYYIDTNEINISQLTKMGILSKNIAVCDVCTYCRSEDYFSHRADGGKTGRMSAVIELI